MKLELKFTENGIEGYIKAYNGEHGKNEKSITEFRVYWKDISICAGEGTSKKPYVHIGDVHRLKSILIGYETARLNETGGTGITIVESDKQL